MRVTHPTHNFGAVRFDLHAAAAAITLLPPPQFPVDRVERHRNARGQSGQCCDKALTMRFSSRLEAQHPNFSWYQPQAILATNPLIFIDEEGCC